MMATKEQERKALEQIKKIVAGLGEGSYIGMAFEGCFEIAEENIENDWGCSMKQRAEKAEKDKEYFHQIANSEAAEITKLEKRAEEAENHFNKAQERIDAWVAKYHECEDGWVKSYNQTMDRYNEASKKVGELELENMKLKAKLYDMMTAGA